MTIEVAVLNFGDGTPKVEKLGRVDGKFHAEAEWELAKSRGMKTMTYDKGPMLLVIGPATVCVAHLSGASDQGLKCETQGRDEEGRFTGELNGRVLTPGEHWVFVVTKGQQLQLHEKKI